MLKQFLGKLPRKSSSKHPPDHHHDSSRNKPHHHNHNKHNGNTTTAAAAHSPSPPSSSSLFDSPLPAFCDVPSADRPALFLRKLSLCSLTFDFSDPSLHPREKDLKRQHLLDLVDYVSSSSPSPRLPDQAILESVRMVSSNLFRSLPPSNHDRASSSSASSSPSLASEADAEDEEPVLDPAWPHLQLVYEFLLRLVASPDLDAKLAKRHVDHAFVLRLLDLFDSEDAREREYLKTILHRVYGKFMVHRPFIRKAVNNIFYRFVFETERHSGIAELLEILGSIINGFALPLKEEHKLFLVRALLPLHKPRCVAQYHQQLSYCVVQFVEKDFKLADTAVRGMLKYWPVTNTTKEVMFLGELEEVLEATQQAEFQRCMGPLFRRIAKCLNSSHFQVAERALFLWNNDHIRNLIVQNRKVILPIIFPALERNTKGHWNQAVQSLTLNVRKLLLDADQELFGDCLLKFKEDEAKEREAEEKRHLTWKQLEEVAAAKDVSNEAVLVSRTVSSLSVCPPPTPCATTGSQGLEP